MKLGILVNAYARTSELDLCLSSLLQATKNIESERLILHQIGIPESMEISNTYSKYFNLDFVNPQSTNALECINSNRIQGLETLFSDFEVDGVLAVEDDVEITADAALFCVYVYDLFYQKKEFRGVNLGSRIPRLNSNDPTDTFSILRYGLHGQASLITRKTWEDIRKKKLGFQKDSGFDSQIELFLKTGFMVTSNFSRYLDRGFDYYATHAVKNSEDKTFVQLRASYLGKNYLPKIPKYSLLQMDHQSWRKDAIEFRNSDTYKYQIKSAIFSSVIQKSKTLRKSTFS